MIGDVRGLGLMLGVELVTLAPPLTITREELDDALAILDASLTTVERGARP